MTIWWWLLIIIVGSFLCFLAIVIAEGIIKLIIAAWELVKAEMALRRIIRTRNKLIKLIEEWEAKQ